MKYIFLNLKRFDIPKELGGVNTIAPIKEWSKYIVLNIQEVLKKYDSNKVEFAMFFPEAHLISAVEGNSQDSPIKIGCQGVFREDTAVGGNFGAFTTNRTANAVKSIGCEYTIIGHCEERRDKLGILQEAGVQDTDAVNRLLNKEVKCAVNGGLKVLYCIGETLEEQQNWHYKKWSNQQIAEYLYTTFIRQYRKRYLNILTAQLIHQLRRLRHVQCHTL